MAAYLLVDIANIRDERTYADYRARVSQGLVAAGGRYLARGGAVDILEGDWRPERLVILEFPSVEAAKSWYTSEDYQEALAIRLANSVGKALIVEGYAAP